MELKQQAKDLFAVTIRTRSALADRTMERLTAAADVAKTVYLQAKRPLSSNSIER